MTTLADDMQSGLEHARLALGGARMNDPDAIQFWMDRVAMWKCALELAREGKSLAEIYAASGLD